MAPLRLRYLEQQSRRRAAIAANPRAFKDETKSSAPPDCVLRAMDRKRVNRRESRSRNC
jgi:hypothetical protein